VKVVGVSSGAGKGGERGDDGVGVGEVDARSGGVAFVRGVCDATSYNPFSDDAGDEMRIWLAGQGGARGAGGVKIKVGGSVGIKQPMWDVDVAGETWVVGVDWVVL
jgi:hypothetical protein